MQQILDAITSSYSKGGLWAVAFALGINAFGVFYEAGSAKAALADHNDTVHVGVRDMIAEESLDIEKRIVRLEETSKARHERMMETLQEIRDVVVAYLPQLRGK